MSKNIFKRKIFIAILTLCFIAIISVSFILQTSAATWNISGSTFSHDPSIIKEGSTWWQFYTANGIGVKFSSNGTNWTQGQSVFSSNLSWWNQYVNKTDRNIWAPDIFYYNGRYWLYYSVSTFGSNTSCIGLASTTSIAQGGWRDDGMVINSTGSNNYNCIDPCLTQDQNGKLWLSFGSYWSGIKMLEVDPNTMKPKSGASITSLANRSGGIEAPYITYNNGYYYLFVSFDKCCSGTGSTYKIAYGRSQSITGPYVDQNGNNMTNGGGTIIDQSSGQWIGPGGQSIARNGSGFLMVHHAYDANKNGEATLRIKDLYFDSNGWPTYTYQSSNNSQTTSNTVVTSAPTSNPTYTNNSSGFTGFYTIANNNSNKFMELAYASTSDWTNITQYSNTYHICQHWELVSADSNSYYVINRNSKKYMEIGNNATNVGATANQLYFTGSNAQKWTFIESNGSYKIKNVNSGLFLQIQNSSTRNSALIEQSSETNSNNQLWTLSQQ